MPFVEIKHKKDFVRIKPDGRITISASLVKTFFKDFTDGFGEVRVLIKIYHDVESKKIGLKPVSITSTGYKLMTKHRVYQLKCIYLSRIVTGEFYPKWSKEHGMLIFSYA